MTATPATAPEQIRLPRRVLRVEISPRTIVAVLVIVASVWMLARLVPVILVLVAALMLVGALNPVVRWLEGKGLRRGWAIGLVMTIAVAFTAGLLFLTIPPLIAQLQLLVENEPQIRSQAVEYLERSPLTRNLAEQLRNVDYSEFFKQSRRSILTTSLHALEIAAYGIAVVFLAVYIMVDHARLRGALFAVVPRKHHVRFSRVLVNLEAIVGGYIRGQVITTALITTFIFVLLLICRVPSALALAVFGGLMDILPYIGPLLTIIPAVAAAYAVGPGTALTVLALLILYEEFEGRILVPLVYGRALRLPSSVVFFSLLVGAALYGIVGALLALPIASAAIMLLDELRVDLPGENDLPENAAARRRDAREEQEYERRTDEAPVKEASAVAVEIARERKEQEETQTEVETGTKRPEPRPFQGPDDESGKRGRG